MAGRKKKSASVSANDPPGRPNKDKKRTRPSGRDNIQPDIRTESASIDNQNIYPATNHTDTDSGPVNITLDTVITLAEAGQLRELLLGRMGAREIQIDVSKVEHIDTAGLQLLLAFSKAIEKKGGKLSWTGWSPAYSGTAELLGLRAAAGVKEN